MSCKKFFSRALLGLLTFNSLNGVSTSAMEYAIKNELINIDDEGDVEKFDRWCGDYSFEPAINENQYKFVKLLEQHKKLFNTYGIILNEDIKEVYAKLFRHIYSNITSGSPDTDGLREKLLELTNMVTDNLSIEYSRMSDVRYCCCEYSGTGKNEKLCFEFCFSNEKLNSIDLTFTPLEE